MVLLCKRIAESKWFSNFILGVILAAGVVVGLQTYKQFEIDHRVLLAALDNIILGIFVIEVVIKVVAEGKRPQNYFKDPWNIFDFTIVVVCFLPIGGKFIPVLRLARVLRVLKLVSAIPRLQILVNAVLKSIPSIGYVFILGLLHFYIYGCMATFLFSENDPQHFRNLQTSMLSLFRAVTLEDWTDLMYINMYGSANYGYDEAAYQSMANIGIPKDQIISTASPVGASVFFVSFILTGAMIVLNLFVGVMLNGMDDARKETELALAAKRKEAENIDIKEEILQMEQQLQEMSQKLSQNLLVLSRRAEENSDKIERIMGKGTGS
ncbi:MAG: ion transporter [Verrucomicrobiota bacterium]|jgi:voltage-gated sodium channel|nr:ion transporter [Verrucomicrobiota bacterium]